MAHDLDATFYITTVPTIEIRSGMVHICYEIGKRAKFEVVFSPHIYLKHRARGAKALAEWNGGAEVEPIKRRG